MSCSYTYYADRGEEGRSNCLQLLWLSRLVVVLYMGFPMRLFTLCVPFRGGVVWAEMGGECFFCPPLPFLSLT